MDIIMKLTDKDIHTIKYETRMGIVLPALILVLAAAFNFLVPIMIPHESWTMIILMDIAVVISCMGLSYFMNRKYSHDLKNGTKNMLIEKVEYTKVSKKYTAGSGALYIPVLGDLFPKLWRTKMQPVRKMNLIINGCRYEVDKDIFDKVKKDDWVEMYYTQVSETLLGIELHNGAHGSTLNTLDWHAIAILKSCNPKIGLKNIEPRKCKPFRIVTT